MKIIKNILVAIAIAVAVRSAPALAKATVGVANLTMDLRTADIIAVAKVEDTPAVKPVVRPVAKPAGKTEELPFKSPAELGAEAEAQKIQPEPEIQSEPGTIAIPATPPELLPATGAEPVPAPPAKAKPGLFPPTKPATKKSPQAQGEFEKEEKEPEQATGEVKKAAEGLVKLPDAIPGKLEYFDVDLPAGQILGMTVIPLDERGTLGVAMLTGSSMEVYRFGSATVLKRIWLGTFNEKYTPRGLAGSIKQGSFNGRPLLFVSMNPFKKAFAYEWKNSHLEKAGKASSLIVEALVEPAVNIVSEYGTGVVTFSGRQTRIVDTSGKEPRSLSYPIPGEYYNGCVMRWSDVSVNLVQIAVATDDGAIQVYQGPRTLKAGTDAVYGNAVVCVPLLDGVNRLITTTQSAAEDAVVLLDFYGNSIEERWRTPKLGGAVTNITPYDFDKDDEPEILGIISKHTGGNVLFRLLPDYYALAPDSTSLKKKPGESKTGNNGKKKTESEH